VIFYHIKLSRDLLRHKKPFVARNKFAHLKVARNIKKVGQACTRICPCSSVSICEIKLQLLWSACLI